MRTSAATWRRRSVLGLWSPESDYADPRKIRGAVYEIDVSQREAHGEAERFGRELMARDKKRFDEIATTETIQCDHQGMVYYPLYEIHYRYGSKSFRSVVDASNGVVCHTAHPMSLKTRVAVKIAGLTYLALALVVALGFALSPATSCGQVVDPIGIGGFGGAGLVFFTALVVGGRILYTALSRSRSGDRRLGAASRAERADARHARERAEAQHVGSSPMVTPGDDQKRTPGRDRRSCTNASRRRHRGRSAGRIPRASSSCLSDALVLDHSKPSSAASGMAPPQTGAFGARGAAGARGPASREPASRPPRNRSPTRRKARCPQGCCSAARER